MARNLFRCNIKRMSWNSYVCKSRAEVFGQRKLWRQRLVSCAAEICLKGVHQPTNIFLCVHKFHCEKRKTKWQRTAKNRSGYTNNWSYNIDKSTQYEFVYHTYVHIYIHMYVCNSMCFSRTPATAAERQQSKNHIHETAAKTEIREIAQKICLVVLASIPASAILLLFIYVSLLRFKTSLK